MSIKEFIDTLKFNSEGLLPAVIQDFQNNEVLMVAYMNKAAVEKTLTIGQTYFYSRSRQKLWTKGETSGHIQLVKEIFFDCDQDTLLVKVEQKVAACHEGYRSCFYRKYDLENKKIETTGKKLFEPKEKY